MISPAQSLFIINSLDWVTEVSNITKTTFCSAFLHSAVFVSEVKRFVLS